MNREFQIIKSLNIDINNIQKLSRTTVTFISVMMEILCRLKNYATTFFYISEISVQESNLFYCGLTEQFLFLIHLKYIFLVYTF